MSIYLDLEERVKLSIRIGESHYREFKSALEGPPGAKKPRPLKEIAQDISRTLVAFANADGGELLIGVEDDSSLSGVPHSKTDVDMLLAVTETHIHAETPLPPVRKTSVVLEGKVVIYFNVSKGTRFIHLTSDGRCLRRVDRESLPVSSEAIQAQRLEDQSRSWEREIAHGATLDDLNLDLIQSVAQQIAYGVSVEKFLQYLDLAEFTPDGLRIKRAAVLLFAKDARRWHSGCSVRLMTIRGKEKRSGEAFNVARDELIADNILKLMDASWERLTATLSFHTQLTESVKFQQTMLYPQVACREAVVNAITHRNYAIEGRGIEISIFQDRMEILSPGMLLSTVSIEDLRNLKGVHESRNPLIARVLREVGFVREMGEGMKRIFNVMRSSALAEPALESSTVGFLVTLFHRSLYDPNVKLWLSNFDEHKLTENQLAVLALGYGGKEFSTQDIINRLGIINIDQIREILTPLRRFHLIEKTKDDHEAIKYSKANRVPKREVPRYMVTSGSQPKSSSHLALPPRVASSVGELEGIEPELHEIFIGNLDFKTTKEVLFDFLKQYGEVQSIDMPEPTFHKGANRGYAFVSLISNETFGNLVKTLDGSELDGRKLSAKAPVSQVRAQKAGTRRK
jgi:ATP-dependent DNA helicase RecG